MIEPTVSWLRKCGELSARAPLSTTSYSVGCVICDESDIELATGFSGELGPGWHAEEAAIAKLTKKRSLTAGLTLYSSLEPCSCRQSRPISCSELILESNIARVIYAAREPPVFACCRGHQIMYEAGVDVVEVPGLIDVFLENNRHILARG